MRNLFSGLLVFMVVVAIGAAAYFFLYIPSLEEVDESVAMNAEDRYALLVDKYADGFGTMLKQCKKNNNVIYVLNGSGTLSSEEYYYDSIGQEIGRGGLVREVSTDILGDKDYLDKLKREVETGSYDCKIIRESKGAIER